MCTLLHPHMPRRTESCSCSVLPTHKNSIQLVKFVIAHVISLLIIREEKCHQKLNGVNFICVYVFARNEISSFIFMV